jgi:methionine-rich copper-binding protein CopC
MSSFVRRAALLAVVAVAAGTLALPAAVIAHAELVSSNPANAATVPGPFAGPIVLTYSEALKSGSHAELLAAGGAKVADAKIDASNTRRMTFTLAAPLDPGAWTVQWTSVAADGDIERGRVTFTVAAPTPSPTAPPTVPPTAAPTIPPTAVPSPSTPPATLPPTLPPSPSPSPTPGTGVPASAADVVIPIVAALALVGAAAWFLLRRRGGPA